MLFNWSSALNLFFFGESSDTPTELSIINNPCLDQEAWVTQSISPHSKGRVYCRGLLWPARCTQPVNLAPKTRVRVTGRDNITLLVEPAYPLVSTGSQIAR